MWLIYNIVLVSGIQQSDSDISEYMHTFFHIMVHYRLLQDLNIISSFPVLHSKFLLLIYFICSVVYLLIPCSWFIPLLLPLPFGNHVCFLCLWLYFGFAYRLICIIFKIPYINDTYNICLSLSDLLHLVWYSLVLSMLLQMAIFPSSLQMNNILNGWYLNLAS